MLDVIGVGNAIVDVLARVDEAFLVKEGLSKGSMTLITEARAKDLFAKMGPVTHVSGGSAANTIAGCASFGLQTAFIGHVCADEMGKIFTHDIQALGVRYETKPSHQGPATATCLIFVTPDGERTMCTYLGASQYLSPHHIDMAWIETSKIIYLEGYLWDPPEAKIAFRKAMEGAQQAGTMVAFSLSDPFCVDRYREEFLALLSDHQIDVLFANQHELKSLFQTGDLKEALQLLQDTSLPIGVITCSEAGAFVSTREEGIISIPSVPVERVVDTTGAGDLFAAGFLTGLCQGAPLRDCAHLGACAASEIIQHYGARSEVDLIDLMEQMGEMSRG